MAQHPEPMTEAQIIEIDQLYKGFQPLEAWSSTSVSTTVWDTSLNELQHGRAAVTAETFDALREETMRQAAIDTGAIEQLYDTDRGFTITVAAMATAWEAEIVAQKGEDVARMVLGHKQAYDLALDVATGTQPITEALIRRMHEEACAGQDIYEVRNLAVGPQTHSLPKGEYKRYPNHVELADGTRHAYAPVDAVRTEMHRFTTVLRSAEFTAAHPVVQAAWAHHAFVAVHPFADGNGRVARVLASIFLLRASSLPFVLFADQRAPYLAALSEADNDEPARFLSFVRDRSLDTVLYVTEALKAHAAPPGLSLLRERLSRRWAREKMAAENMVRKVTAQQRLVQLVSELVEELGNLGCGDLALQIDTRPEQIRSAPAEGFDLIYNTNAVRVDVHVETERGDDSFIVVTAKDEDDPFAFRLWSWKTNDMHPVRYSDLVPEVTAQLRLRLRAWLQRQVNELVRRMAEDIEA